MPSWSRAVLLGTALALCLAPGHSVSTPPLAKPPKKQTLPKVEAEAAAEAAEPPAEAAEELEAAAAEAVAEENEAELPEEEEETGSSSRRGRRLVDACRCLVRAVLLW